MFQALREHTSRRPLLPLGDGLPRPHVPALSRPLLRTRISPDEPADRPASRGSLDHLGAVRAVPGRPLGPLQPPTGSDPCAVPLRRTLGPLRTSPQLHATLADSRPGRT